MVNIYRLSAAMALFLCSSQAVEVTGDYTQPEHVFYIGHGAPPKIESTLVFSGGPWDGLEVNDQFNNWCTSNQQDAVLPIIQGCSVNVSFDAGIATGICNCSAYDPRGEGSSTPVSYSSSASVRAEESQSCPPEDRQTFSLNVSLGGNLFCYDPAGVDARESCSVNPSDEDFILPVTGNTQQSVCKSKEDGSQCAYSLTEDGYYARDFETSCYSGTTGQYSEHNNQPPQEEGQCVVDSGFLVCRERPENMCVGDSCYSGCGTVGYNGQTAFVCYTSDTDGDTVPDYSDPDIDGDGIPNNEDLDSDGDGVDDASYDNIAGDIINNPGSPSQGGQTPEIGELTVNVDMTPVVDAVNDVKASVNDVKSSVDNIEQVLTEGTNFQVNTTELGSASFYTSQYPGGIAQVWEAKQAELLNTPGGEYIQSWNVEVSGNYVWPQICFDLGFVNFGCFQLSIDERVIPFIRILLIFSAIVLSRKITLGG